MPAKIIPRKLSQRSFDKQAWTESQRDVLLKPRLRVSWPVLCLRPPTRNQSDGSRSLAIVPDVRGPIASWLRSL